MSILEELQQVEDFVYANNLRKFLDDTKISHTLKKN